MGRGVRSVVVLACCLSVPPFLSTLSPRPALAVITVVHFQRGDADADGGLNITDAVFTLNYLFTGGPAPPCLKSADANDSGGVDLTDAISALNFLFLQGIRPPDPFGECGSDPTADALTCKAHPPCEFSSLVASYSILRTLAGKGEVRTNNVNSWRAEFEGGAATAAELSRPHFAMRDDAGDLYIADKNSHAIRRVDADGRIFTAAGTNVAGDGDDTPGPATSRQLSNPNGLWVRSDGTVYILDLDNGKIRRLGPDGVLTTWITVPGGISIGRGLWVSDDESLVYFSSGRQVKRWTPTVGVEVVADGFASLGTLVVDPGGRLVVTDRAGNRVYRIHEDGSQVAIAGNGSTSGGGTGRPALETGLDEVRGVWFIPEGGYFLATHEGSQIWYVDTRGIIHLFLDGRFDHSHSGDGEHFRTAGFKISEARGISLDREGNILITENDYGYVRIIDHR